MGQLVTTEFLNNKLSEVPKNLNTPAAVLIKIYKNQSNNELLNHFFKIRSNKSMHTYDNVVIY